MNNNTPYNILSSKYSLLFFIIIAFIYNVIVYKNSVILTIMFFIIIYKVMPYVVMQLTGEQILNINYCKLQIHRIFN